MSTEVSTEHIQQLRNSFLKKLEAAGESAAHPSDIEKVKTSDDWLRRFLLHHDLNQEEALKMLWETVQWRKDFKTNEITENNINMDYILEGSVFSRGRDKDGCALFVFKCKKHTKGSKDMDEFQRCIVYWFERLEKEENGKPITLFFDMDGCGLANMDMEVIKYLIGLCKHYYPFFLNYIIIYEMAWILSAAFKIIKTWLPEKAIEKIKQIKKGGIGEYVPLDQALVSWGGNDDYTFAFVSLEQQSFENNLNSSTNNRKVHFADGSPMSETSGTNFDKESAGGDGGVLSIKPTSVITFIKENNELLSTIDLENTDASVIISYKMKTTSPEKFRVRPSVGCLKPGEQATITVTLLPGFQLGGLSRDKFLVMSMPIESIELSSQELTELWKNTSSKYVTQHRLRVVQTGEAVKNGSATTVASHASETLQNKTPDLSASVAELAERCTKLQASVKHLQLFQDLTIVLIIFLGIILVYILRTEIKSLTEQSCYRTPDVP